MSGGGGEAGKDLATSGLDEIANGLTLALGELKELGMDSMAGEGRGFGAIALPGLALGHEGLTGTFSSFCERWEWGVRALINEGNTFAVATGLSAGTYHETEQYLEGTFKIVTNAAIGNPYASEDEVTKQGWGDIATSGYLGGVDYSKESFDEARANSAQGWKDAGRDLMTSQTVGLPGLGPQNSASMAGVTDAQYEAALDDMFGPSPEERAAAAQQQQSVPPQQQRGDQG
ncbi:hypothetical protein GPZ77_20645 [Streptomyces sp. QHH-9511]|uniref:hypothetical protein n=1 Tax=Streptomyces sp. QHH-9511 TaxID=2684468 RepID=UPI0013191607|nr:hypothetical protein [Streptomyces sp. QHH-9511]QGZ50451.1 hypothetical protein GPZ77_20645 [Streptomyces sp. QHH-9511]